MRKAEKVERFRLPFATPLSLVDRIRTKLQQPCFLGMQFQVELLHSFRKFRPKLIGIRFALESSHDVIRESHHDDIAVRALLTPCLDPQIECVMKIDVRQERRGTSALGRPFFRSYSFPILQHASLQPFLDEPHDAPVCNPVLNELHKPFVGKPIEKAFDVQIEHPVHFLRLQSGVQSIQRLMLAAPWSEAIRKPEKIRFVDSIHHLDRRALDDLVFQRRNSERSLPPVGLRDKHPSHRLRSIRSSLQPFGKFLKIPFQLFAVVSPRLSVHARRGFLLQREVGHAQRFQVVDVVQKRREPQLLILSCCLTYPLQRTQRVFPARCPERVLLRRTYMPDRRDAVKMIGMTAIAGICGLDLHASLGQAQQSSVGGTPYSLPPLPYAYDALEPYIDAQTMHLHHDKHHAAYVKNLNAAVVDHPDLAKLPVEDLIRHLERVPEPIRTAVRNNGGGHANHSFFWRMMEKTASGQPKGDLAKAIDAKFGSLASFEEQFTKAALSVFGSGWAWLSANEKRELSIETTPNQDSPWMTGRTPILGIDVWEHAYYLKYQNVRADYVATFHKVVSWDFASERFQDHAS